MIWDELKKDPIRYELVSIAQEAVDLYEDEKLSLVDALLKNGVTIQRWIPVSERLPEKDMDVLLYDTQSATTFLGEFCSRTTLFAEHWFADNETWDISEFTHWMPLPEPPKEET